MRYTKFEFGADMSQSKTPGRGFYAASTWKPRPTLDLELHDQGCSFASPKALPNVIS